MSFRTLGRPLRPQPVHLIALAAAAAFSSFYCFYAAAPTLFADSTPSAGIRVGLLMLIVVGVQPAVVLLQKHVPSRKLLVIVALAFMSSGLLALPLDQGWFGLLGLGIGFGMFVVVSTAWTKEVSAPTKVGRALGTYGFGSAVGGAVGAPIGLALTQYGALPAVALGAATLAAAGMIPSAFVRAEERGRIVRSRMTSTVREATTIQGSWSMSIAVHLVTVSVYATVLAATGTIVGSSTTSSAILAVFLIQLTVALGRSAGGFLADQAPGLLILTASLLGTLLAAALFLYWPTSSAAVLFAGLVGLTAGVGQTTALTLMMRQSNTSGQTNKASAAWNITFDIGLGLGALGASALVAG